MRCRQHEHDRDEDVQNRVGQQLAVRGMGVHHRHADTNDIHTGFQEAQGKIDDMVSSGCIGFCSADCDRQFYLSGDLIKLMAHWSNW